MNSFFNSSSAKKQIDLSLSDFGQPDIFGTGHQSASESEKLLRESIPREVDRKSRVPEVEIGVQSP